MKIHSEGIESVNCLQLQVLMRLNCECGGSNLQRYLIIYAGQHGMISEWTLVLSSFVGNKLEYYPNMLLLIILKRKFSHLILWPLV